MRTVSIVLLTCLLGCQATHVDQPLTSTLGGDDTDTQMEFWHQLSQRPMTSNDEAFHGLLLFLDQSDHSADYAARVSTLRSRGMLPSGFDRPADEAITRGTLAVAISRALQIKGGMMMQLSGGTNPRYAMRELIYLDLYPPSSTNQTFSGSEFLGVVGRMEDYQRSSAPDVPPNPQ